MYNRKLNDSKCWKLNCCCSSLFAMLIFQTEPFARNKSQTTSPRQLEGYIIDLLDELSESVSDVHLHFNVTPVADGKYGDKVGREWNGMMGEITGSSPVSESLLVQ